MSNSHPRSRSTRWALALTVAVAALAFSQSAFAAFTSSQITSPGDNSFVQYTVNTPNTVHVTGTVSGGTGNADLVCFWGTSRKVVKQNVAVSNNSFSTDVALDLLGTLSPRPYCVLRAVPTGDLSTYAPDQPSPFAGVHIGVGEFDAFQTAGQLSDYFLGQGQARGYMDYYSAGSCGISSSSVFNPVTLQQSKTLFYCNGWMYSRNGADTASQYSAAGTRSELEVDGKPAYLPATASGLYYVDATHRSELLSGIPKLLFDALIDPANGNVHAAESSDVVRCAPNGAAYHVYSNPAWQTDCTSFASTGVKLERAIAGDKDGRRSTITDVWSSTDGQSHELDLEYEEDFKGSQQTQSPAFSFSWTGNQDYAPGVLGATVDGPAGDDPATALIDGNGGSADVPEYPQGAVTFAPAPDSVRFTYVNAYSAAGVWRLARTVPAGGSVKIVHVYTQGETKDEVVAQAAADREELGAPKPPADGPPGDDPTPATTDAPGASGASDSSADTLAPVIGLTTARVKLAALLKKGLPIKASCSEACAFKVALTIDARIAKRIGLATAGIGRKSSSLTAAGSKKLTIKLSRKAQRKLARVKSVRLKVTLSATDAARNSSQKTKVATIRR
ncbi:MAG TPA: hypothetical protein VF066_00035 [Thermoleophilaceae bacterium]